MLSRTALAERRLAGLLTYADARRRARRALPRLLFDYVDGGADDELTMRHHAARFGDLRLRPRTGEWVPTPRLATEVLGTELSMPVLTAPCGGMRLVHPDGDLGVARAAARAGVAPVVPSGGGYSLDEVAAAGGVQWFQLYKFSHRSGMEALVGRAHRAGYRAMVATIDTNIAGNRERDLRNGFSYDLRINAASAVRLGPQLVPRPGWAFRFWRDGMPFELPNTAPFGSDGRAMPLTEMARSGAESFSPTWEDVAWLRSAWDRALVVKGVLTGEDARRAVGLGADAVVVSNHGGRQLDGVPATIDALSEVVAPRGRRPGQGHGQRRVRLARRRRHRHPVHPRGTRRDRPRGEGARPACPRARVQPRRHRKRGGGGSSFDRTRKPAGRSVGGADGRSGDLPGPERSPRSNCCPRTAWPWA